MKHTRLSLDGAFFALLGVGLFAIIVLAILNDMGVIDISWLDVEGSSSGDVDPGGYNQGPNHVPARPGSGAGGARGR
ncbi:hypothetical protein [Streptomyces ureilyticus]|uniref:Uncharacterized protein n=1 Tax=Streptomyces ureilyticus TaxID=1775131 RepID=A0ABX0DYD9_9ACTN|nr:hypothetical protein [Streptomyces ureilyticus]NGO45914.1 hypothetical protein [Streptomyces ureilyticus]